MSTQQLLVLAVAAMLFLAVSRVVRVRLGRAPHPDGLRKFLFILAFVFVPPLALDALVVPVAATNQLHGIEYVPLYVVMLVVLATLMAVIAMVVRFVARGYPRRFLLLALIGSDNDLDAVPVDPPVTAGLAESMATVDRANAAFARGPSFPDEIDRVGFRAAWDTLDHATSTLESQISADDRLRLGVARTAAATAKDARSRLETLRRLAAYHGQTWAAR